MALSDKLRCMRECQVSTSLRNYLYCFFKKVDTRVWAIYVNMGIIANHAFMTLCVFSYAVSLNTCRMTAGRTNTPATRLPRLSVTSASPWARTPITTSVCSRGVAAQPCGPGSRRPSTAETVRPLHIRSYLRYDAQWWHRNRSSCRILDCDWSEGID